MAASRKPRMPSAAKLERLRLSREVAWYLISRGIPLPDCPPKVKTPEPGEVLADARFDPLRVDKVIATFMALQHTQGRWAGQPLRPDPWQVAYILAPVFGWVRFDDEAGDWVRVIRELYVDVPRKNGKSTTCCGIGIHLTCADGEAGAQVLAAATTKDQAGFVFAPARQLAEHSPKLKQHVKAYAAKIVHPRSGSYFQPVSSVAEAQHGANVHGGIVDELHVHESADLVEAIETGTGSRTQPLMVFITTADTGRRNTIYDRKRRLIEQLERRVFKHPQTYGVVFAADDDDQYGDKPFLEKTQRKANPGFGVSPTRAYLAQEAAKARNSPADLAKYLRLHLGIRTKQATRYIDLDVWDASAGMVVEEKLAGRSCHGGLDLASVEDLAALCWSFRDEHGGYDNLWRFWLPADRLPHLSKRTAGNAEVWVRQGFLTLTPGNVIDNDVIRAQVVADAGKFSVQTVGYDRWGAVDLVRRLGDDGITCVPVGQGYASLSAPMREILRLLLAKRYRHSGNPVMRWMVDNLAVAMDPAGNVKPDKATSGDKIDGVSAAATAMKECLDTDEPEELDGSLMA